MKDAFRRRPEKPTWNSVEPVKLVRVGV